MKRRGKFSLSHKKNLSLDMGELVPIGCYEVLPGDSMQQATSMLVRLTPMVAPMFAQVMVKCVSVFVPTRLLWTNFEKFITGGPDGNDATVAPTINITSGGSGVVGGLADYLGVPTGINISVSALPFRAYAKIFNDCFRDEDLVTEVGLSLADGVDATTNTALLNAAWMKDRFTSARPWPQKGTGVTIPLGTTAPVSGIGVNNTPVLNAPGITGVRETVPGSSLTYTNAADANNSGGPIRIKFDGAASGTVRPAIFADLTGASAITVTALRQALAIQRYMEMRARYGSRYVEYLRALGVTSSDARLQRPEILSSSMQPIQISEVLATAEGTSTKVGDLKGHGIGGFRSYRWRRFFEEHGFVMTLCHIQPKTQYVQGLPKMFSRPTKYDYWQPEIEHIGQETILNKEVYGPHATPDGVFGYQDRFDTYRREESTVHGEFRTTLNYWHMARIFASDPALNSTFVQSNPTKRVFAVTTNDCVYLTVNHSIQARRLLSQSGTSFIM